MGTLSSFAALAALLAVLAADAGAVEFNVTDATPADYGGAGLNSSEAAVYWGPWTPARATWYGQPNGAGPDDNGEDESKAPTFLVLLAFAFPRSCGRNEMWLMSVW